MCPFFIPLIIPHYIIYVNIEGGYFFSFFEEALGKEKSLALVVQAIF